MTLPSLSSKAAEQVRGLLSYHESKLRPEAVCNLLQAIEQARARIEQPPLTGQAAPRPHPDTAPTGERWIKEGRYWFGHTLTTPPVVIEVFFETADIPTRR